MNVNVVAPSHPGAALPSMTSPKSNQINANPPPLPPPLPPAALPMQTDFPPISVLLIKEAEAWRALLQLSSTVLRAGQTTVSTLTDNNPFYTSENQDDYDQREAAYSCSLSQLLSSADSLIYEAVKLRGLRKAKTQTEVAALRELFKTHSNEILSTGEALCRNSAFQMASLSNEIRKKSQQLKVQIQQARGLLAVLNESNSLKNAPSDATIVIGYQKDGEEAVIQPVSDVLKRVFERGNNLVDEAVCDALFVPEGADCHLHRVFTRRSGVGARAQEEPLSGDDAR